MGGVGAGFCLPDMRPDPLGIYLDTLTNSRPLLSKTGVMFLKYRKDNKTWRPNAYAAYER